jgi:hypothetical protein
MVSAADIRSTAQQVHVEAVGRAAVDPAAAQGAVEQAKANLRTLRLVSDEETRGFIDGLTEDLDRVLAGHPSALAFRVAPVIPPPAFPLGPLDTPPAFVAGAPPVPSAAAYSFVTSAPSADAFPVATPAPSPSFLVSPPAVGYPVEPPAVAGPIAPPLQSATAFAAVPAAVPTPVSTSQAPPKKHTVRNLILVGVVVAGIAGGTQVAKKDSTTSRLIQRRCCGHASGDVQGDRHGAVRRHHRRDRERGNLATVGFGGSTHVQIRGSGNHLYLPQGGFRVHLGPEPRRDWHCHLHDRGRRDPGGDEHLERVLRDRHMLRSAVTLRAAERGSSHGPRPGSNQNPRPARARSTSDSPSRRTSSCSM